MTDPSPADPGDYLRAVFRGLVELQDAGVSVSDSRRQVAARFNIPVREVRVIEKAGMDGEWPPLGEGPPADPPPKPR